MKNFLDRVPTNPNRKKITFEADPVSGVNYGTVEFADTPSEAGTSLNRSAFMALQGFQAITYTFNIDGTITEENEDGDTLVTTFVSATEITEVFTCGTVVLTRTTTFSGNVISQVIS